ncbi:carboxypeptidase-like regulatory domain-containing protein [uncultured Winogradskyella sp.]|uniref:carboxypeptidase-like regulatory domain-containing protein n=1 Tax=uncultured Winogradskyella sp. TaxID=395353 RepID=UPI0030DD8F42|tara:strand:+ start:107582 stop:108808 length:1227 start_codon:yes stop_codon:yes gene_type:complete
MSNTYYKSGFLKKLLLIISVFLGVTIASSQNKIEITGTVFDEYEMPIPYASVGIPSKYIGTSTNDDGVFSMRVSAENMSDSLEISSIGFKTYKIKVEDYINNNVTTIILKEEVVSLDAVIIQKPAEIVKIALKNLRKTSLSSRHQIDMLYRRSSVENGKTRFMVEHYLNLMDFGPSDLKLDEVGIAESRKSADYRFAFKKQAAHAVHVMTQINPLRKNINVKDYQWKRIDDTAYDGEDILIIQGKKKSQKKHQEKNWIKLYIGLDTYGIYKVEVSRHASEFSNLKAFYLYKKNSDGKLVLSYHNREANFRTPISEEKQRLLKLKTKNVVSSYRHEAIVLHIETNRKKFDVKNSISESKDMGDYNITYNADFWRAISLPPETKFYKKSVTELESIYGVPLETQFNGVNN